MSAVFVLTDAARIRRGIRRAIPCTQGMRLTRGALKVRSSCLPINYQLSTINRLAALAMLFTLFALSGLSRQAQAQQRPLFGPSDEYTTDFGAYASVVADFNHDGIPDIAVVNRRVSSVSVLLGNGDGTFQDPLEFAVGSRPESMAVADVNGDGKPDIVTASTTNGNVSVLLGNGDGTFQSPLTFATDAVPEGVAIGDVNGDGKPDIVTANYENDTVGVLFGNGDGTFQTVQLYNAGSGPQAIVLADLNHDGKLDIVTANSYGGTFSTLLNNGDGTFGASSDLPVGQNPYAVAVADLNHDGNLDVVVPGYSDDNVSVYFGNGDGTFQSQQIISTGSGSGPDGLVIVDINGDGKLDLVTANYTSNSVSVLPGNGDGTFGDLQTYAINGIGPNWLAVGDFNGDGFPDLVTANFTSGDASVLLNNRGLHDVTSQMRVTRGGLRFNRGTNLYAQQITLKNTSSASIPGSVFLALDGLPPGVTLASANGLTQSLAPFNSPYMNVYPTTGNRLAPGASVTDHSAVQQSVQSGVHLHYAHSRRRNPALKPLPHYFCIPAHKSAYAMRLLSTLSLLCIGTLCHAQTQAYHIRMDTSPLVGHAAGPFALNFQFTDGSGNTPGDANNTVRLFNFAFGGGSGAGTPTAMGGVTGNLASSVTLTDTGLLNDFAQEFTPGSVLDFDLTLTNRADASGTPDEFTFAILDSSGTELPTLGLANVGSDVFLLTDLTGDPLNLQAFASDDTQSPAGGGTPLTIAAPTIAAVPEPGNIALLASLMAGSGLLCHQSRKRRA